MVGADKDSIIVQDISVWIPVLIASQKPEIFYPFENPYIFL